MTRKYTKKPKADAKPIPEPKPLEAEMSAPFTATEPKVKPKPAIPDDPRLPDKGLFRVDEAANYFQVSERTIRLWIDHNHLEAAKIVGTIRIPRNSILKCRFRSGIRA